MDNYLEVLDLLGNDVKVVDATIRAVDEKRGVQNLRFPGRLMPDGQPFDAEVPKELSPTILKEWCNAVRREFDARQRSKEDQAAIRARAVEASGAGERSPTRERVPDRRDAEKTGEEIEEALEDALKSEVSKWARAERTASEEVSRLSALADEAAKRRTFASAKRATAERVLQFYLEAMEAATVAPKDR